MYVEPFRSSRSVANFSQGWFGNGVLKSGSLCRGIVCLQTGHFLIKSLSALVTPGHHTAVDTLNQHF